MMLKKTALGKLTKSEELIRLGLANANFFLNMPLFKISK